MLRRHHLENSIHTALHRSRGVVLSGPRQSGKSTLAQQFLKRESPNYFDLEYPPHAQRLEHATQTLEHLQGLVVIDEVQRKPDLFPLLRVLMDRSNAAGQYLLLGSASANLLRQAGESLLGRVETIEVGGFDLAEICAHSSHRPQELANRLWLRGGFPPSYLATTDADSFVWRTQAIADHVRVDMPQFGINIAAPAMLRFWTMLAHYQGQTWNASSMAASLGVSAPTCRTYLDALSGVFMVRQLLPWHENLGKRQVKAPKIYFRDSGLFHTLSHIRSPDELLTHSKLGASWEGYAIEEAIRHHAPDEAYFWATHNHAELDLLLMKDGKRIGIECKRADAPKLTPSMRVAQEDLKLDHLYVYYPGGQRYALNENVTVEPLAALASS